MNTTPPFPIDSLDNSQKYICLCEIVRESKLIEKVDFELRGSQIKDLWKKLASTQITDWNLQFCFGYYPKEIPLKIFAYDSEKVNTYFKLFNWPILFPA